MGGSWWVDDEAVPLVRPYALVRGRTHARKGAFDLVSYVVAVMEHLDTWLETEPEHTRLLSLCRQPLSVSELTARSGLPIGVVRVLLGDLLVMGAIRVREPFPDGERPSLSLIRMVLAGLQAL